MPSKLKIYLTAGLIASASVPYGAQVFAVAKANARTASQVSPRGQILALSCAGCHGTDGKSVGIIPSFYGKSPQYLEEALKDFKSGARVSTVMGRHAKGYSDEEIHLIAEYFGTVWKKNK
ncbi:MAG: sulfide dehydrogenase [Chlorobiaceae bacterium]|nr:sulfide dehydrogenase [Chlorobiaceae bacterium]NTW73324.1 sulfide dehydrogenase [Chlorobiaceae bacterium]